MDRRDGSIDEEPVEEDVEGRDDENDDGRDVHETLRLKVLLSDTVAGCRRC